MPGMIETSGGLPLEMRVRSTVAKSARIDS